MSADWAASTVAVYCALLLDRVNFAQTAYGDGEWRCILGQYPEVNANNEAFTPKIGEALARTMTHPNGQWGLLWPRGSAAVSLRPLVDQWIAENAPDMRWMPHRPFGWANQEGRAGPFFRALAARNTVLVGPGHLAGLPPEVLSPRLHIRVPGTTAMSVWQEVCTDLVAVLEPDDVVVVCAGMSANLIVHRMNGMFARQATFLDVGAMFDPYVGVNSRRAYRDPQWHAEIKPRNLT